MATLTHRNLAFHLDNSAGTLTDISAFVNSIDMGREIAALEDTGLGLEERTFVPGLGGAKLTINGFVNTTTDGIFGPAYISDNTSATKTFAYRLHSTRFYKGEAWASVSYAGSFDSIQTFAATLTLTGAMTRTSIVGT